jgi:hypothetical protein
MEESNCRGAYTVQKPVKSRKGAGSSHRGRQNSEEIAPTEARTPRRAQPAVHVFS